MDAPRGTVGGGKSLSNRQLFQPYVDARWGLKNHWFPALFSDELKEGEFKTVTISGEPILLHRKDGKVHAVEDRCAHRGVRFSQKIYNFKPCLVTCWYHGFTYDMRDGELKTIVAAPDDPLIGNLKIKVYPVEEKYTIIFLFVGDEDFDEVPPLETDLPPPHEPGYRYHASALQDEDRVVVGIRRTGKSNWRLAVENGFDPGHVLIHWKSPLLYALDVAFPLGFKPLTNNAISTFETDGEPIGIMNNYVPEEDGTFHYAPVMENEMLGIRSGHASMTGKMPGMKTSIWLPGVLRVDNFPQPGVMLYEFYVPSTEDNYEYWELMCFPAKTEAERAEVMDRYENFWRKAVFNEFNDDDLWARDAMQAYYEDGTGFDVEKLGAMDAVIVGWRKLVSMHARGIQQPPQERAKRCF